MLGGHRSENEIDSSLAVDTVRLRGERGIRVGGDKVANGVSRDSASRDANAGSQAGLMPPARTHSYQVSTPGVKRHLLEEESFTPELHQEMNCTQCHDVLDGAGVAGIVH